MNERFTGLPAVLGILRVPSALALVLVNLIPLLGAIFLGWNAFDVIFLYWLENIVVGFYTVIKMLFARGRSETKLTLNGRAVNPNSVKDKLGVTVFFVFHCGLFTLVHGVFVVLLFGSKSSFWIQHDFLALTVFFAALLVSHGFSLWRNFFGRQEYLEKGFASYFWKPYGRIILIHLTVLIGAFAAQSVPLSVTAIVVFVVIKIVIDLAMHLASHGVSLKLRAG